jgi:hypothetical protein
VVIGGSRGRGTDRPDSDLDLGIYYEPHLPLDLVSLNQIAARLDDTHRPDLLTPIGGWGPWINGGGWLKMGGLEVDFIYRDLAKVRQVIADCCKGIISIHYQPGHPHGFTSHIYMGEVATSRILYDPAGALAELRDATNPYPPGLKQAVIKAFFWGCDLALQTARKGAARGDTAYVAGCIFRGLACLLQTLFAINGVYWLNEKGALALADAFSIKPQHLRPSVERAFSSLTSNPTDLLAAVDRLDALIAETGIFLKSG